LGAAREGETYRATAREVADVESRARERKVRKMARKSTTELLWMDEDNGAGETAKNFAEYQREFDAKLLKDREEQIKALRSRGDRESIVRAALMEEYGN
jgi:hypothetical protein